MKTIQISKLSLDKIAKLKLFYETEMQLNVSDVDVLEILVAEGYKALEKELAAKLNSASRKEA